MNFSEEHGAELPGRPSSEPSLSDTSSRPQPDASSRRGGALDDPAVRREALRSRAHRIKREIETNRGRVGNRKEDGEWSAYLRDEVIGMLLEGWTVGELDSIGISRELIEQVQPRLAKLRREARD